MNVNSGKLCAKSEAICRKSDSQNVIKRSFSKYFLKQLNNYSPLPDDFGLRSGLEPLCNIRLIFNSLDQVCEPRVFLENLYQKETEFFIFLNVYTILLSYLRVVNPEPVRD